MSRGIPVVLLECRQDAAFCSANERYITSTPEKRHRTPETRHLLHPQLTKAVDHEALQFGELGQDLERAAASACTCDDVQPKVVCIK